MKYTKEYIARMRVASNLLEPPANEVVVELLDEIERLQEEARWIPVSERLPEASEWVLVSGNGLVSVGYFDSVMWWSADDLRFPFEPTHWRPLPQPPEVRG